MTGEPPKRINARSDKRKETVSEPTAMAVTLLSERLRPIRPFTPTPSRGTSGISHNRKLSIGPKDPSPLQPVNFVHVQSLAAAVNGDDNRKTDSGFSCGNDHYEKHK